MAICQLVLLWVKQLMRVLGLDFGSKTTGVAVSDPLGFTAQGLETITREDENKLRRTCARIEELIREYQIETIVLGYPKNMNNTSGERVEKTLAFKEMLGAPHRSVCDFMGRTFDYDCCRADFNRKRSAPREQESSD